MFVSQQSNLYPPFLKKLRPLQPAFTSALGRSDATPNTAWLDEAGHGALELVQSLNFSYNLLFGGRENLVGVNKFNVDKGLLSTVRSNPRTRAPFKPQKSGRGTSSWQLKQYAEATLGSGSLRKAVKLPESEDKDEWLAVNGT